MPIALAAESIAKEFGTRAFQSPDELIAAGVQAVSVAVPTIHHLTIARQMMENGVDVLIEKPLAATVAEADELIELAPSHGRIAQAGHLERFNPAVRATVPLLIAANVLRGPPPQRRSRRARSMSTSFST